MRALISSQHSIGGDHESSASHHLCQTGRGRDCPVYKRSDNRPREGRIALRFFRLESGGTSLRFIAEPAEAFELWCRMCKVHVEGGKEGLSHRFEANGNEILSKLTAERYTRNGKNGFALGLKRGDEEINVPMTPERFLHAAEFLRHLSFSEAWVEETERGERDAPQP